MTTKKIFRNILVFLALMHAKFVYALDNPAPGLFPDFRMGEDVTAEGAIMFIISNILLPLVGLISMLFIIIGGFQYITARGNDEQAESGKKTLTNAIIGLVIVIFSYVIVTVIINALKPDGSI